MANQNRPATPKKISTRPHMFDSPESASLWFDIFNGVLFLGALLVTIGTWGTIKTAGIKERFSDERIAANEAETKRAVADSDAAKEGAAKANARAAEAQLALEKFKAPRLLSPEQVALIAKKIPNLPMNSLAVGVVDSSVEAVSLADQIFKILSMSGLRPNVNNSFASNTFGVFAGVMIQYTTGNDSSERIAGALLDALKAEGIAAKSVGGMHESVYVSNGFDRSSPSARNLLVAIGEKPK
jgi:hypothetical protein